MGAAKVVVLRHGLTDWNDVGRFQGQADVPLNALGLGQAEMAASALVGSGITRIVSSDLVRAATTADIIGRRLGLPVTVDPRLQEVNVGTWSGLTTQEVAASDPEFSLALAEGRDFPRSPTGETATQAGARMAGALLDHAEAADDGEIVLAVGHGLASRIAALLLIGLDYSHARLFVGLGNCHWLSLRPQEPAWRLVSYNESA